MDSLTAYIEKFVQFSTIEKEAFTGLFNEIQLSKNDYFALAGEFSSKLSFLNNGVMRAFYRNNSGKEYNKTFFTNCNFVAAYASLTTKRQNLINIQCLTDCNLLVAEYSKI